MANQDLYFDITKTGIEQERQQYIINRVGDGGLKTVTVHVLSNGRPYNLTGLNPIFEGLKPDSTKIIDAHGAIILDEAGGVFRYTFPTQASAVEGEYQQAFFKLRRGEQTDSTIELKVNVLPNRVELGINSQTYISEFIQAAKELETEYSRQMDTLKNVADATKQRVDGNQELAETLRSRLTNLQNNINDGELVTHEQLTSEVSALSDMIKKIASGLKDAKSTADQAVTNASNVVNDIQNTTVSSSVSSEPISDVDNIRETGYYFYNETTRNLPLLNGGNQNGYIHAVMRNGENGMIEIMGTGYSRERYGGRLYDRWVTTKPVSLWSGTGKAGNILALRGNVHAFKYLIFEVEFYTNNQATIKIRVPANSKNFYLDAIGLKTNANLSQALLEEASLVLTDDTHIKINSLLVAKDGGAAAASNDITIKEILGVG